MFDLDIELDPVHVIAALLIILAFALCASVIVLLRRGRNQDSESHWLGGIAFVVLYFTFMHFIDAREATIRAEMQREARIADMIRAGYIHPDKSVFRADINQCPPRTDGMTDQLLLLITTESDTAPRITGCTRIAQRRYIVKQTTAKDLQ